MGSMSDLQIDMKNVAEEILMAAESLDYRVQAGLPIQGTMTSMVIKLKKLALMAELNMEAFHDNEYTVHVTFDYEPADDDGVAQPIWDYLYPDLRTGPMAHYWIDRKDAEKAKFAYMVKTPDEEYNSIAIYSVDFMGWEENNDE